MKSVSQYYRVLNRGPIGCVEPTVTTTAEYTAVRAKASSLGYTLPSSTQDAINNRIIFYLKYVGLWDRQDIFYFFNQEAGLADFCTLNWKDPNSFQLNQSNPALKPDFVAGQGFQGGSGKYWKTGYIPRTSRINLSINNASAWYDIFGIPSTFSSVSYIAGARNANDNGQMFFVNSSSGQTLHRVFSATGFTLAQANQNGQFLSGIYPLSLMPPGSTNNVRVVRNETTPIYVGFIGSSLESTLTDKELYLLAFNNNGTLTTGGSAGLKYFALSKALDGLQLPDDPAYVEYLRRVFQIMNGTYLACP